MSKEEAKKEWAAQFKSIAGDKLDAFKTAFAAHTEKFKAYFNEVPPVIPPVAPPVKLDSVAKTKDGKILSIAGETPAVGVMVMDTTSGTPVALADGEYELEDGSKITIVGGAITVYTPVVVQPPMDMIAATTALKAEFASHKVEFEKSLTAKFAKETNELKEVVSDLVKMNAQVFEIINSLSETPAVEPKKTASADEFEKMTPLEKRRYHKSNAI